MFCTKVGLAFMLLQGLEASVDVLGAIWSHLDAQEPHFGVILESFGGRLLEHLGVVSAPPDYILEPSVMAGSFQITDLACWRRRGNGSDDI